MDESEDKDDGNNTDREPGPHIGIIVPLPVDADNFEIDSKEEIERSRTPTVNKPPPFD